MHEEEKTLFTPPGRFRLQYLAHGIQRGLEMAHAFGWKGLLFQGGLTQIKQRAILVKFVAGVLHKPVTVTIDPVTALGIIMYEGVFTRIIFLSGQQAIKVYSVRFHASSRDLSKGGKKVTEFDHRFIDPSRFYLIAPLYNKGEYTPKSWTAS